jgi:hypothetical protein
MRYSNLSNNIWCSKRTVNNNYNSNTVVKQYFAVVKQVDGRVALHMTDTTQVTRAGRAPPPPPPPPPPYQIMLDPSLFICNYTSVRR